MPLSAFCGPTSLEKDRPQLQIRLDSSPAKGSTGSSSASSGGLVGFESVAFVGASLVCFLRRGTRLPRTTPQAAPKEEAEPGREDSGLAWRVIKEKTVFFSPLSCCVFCSFSKQSSLVRERKRERKRERERERKRKQVFTKKRKDEKIRKTNSLSLSFLQGSLPNLSKSALLLSTNALRPSLPSSL